MSIASMPPGMDAIISLLVIATVVWVGIDASRRDFSGSRFASKTWHWVVGTLLLWILILPIYLLKRRDAPLKG